MNGDRSGAMPFALIAVAILLAASGMAALVSSHERAEDATDGYGRDTDAVDVTASGIAEHVSRGLGGIIRDVSVSEDMRSDSLEEREGEFDRRTAEWMESEFPLTGRGARAELEGYEIGLSVEPMGLAEEDGYTPAYLVGTGTVTVRITTASGDSLSQIPIRADGSHALPLAVGRASVFESMAGGSGLSLSQMMSHQLTAVAQQRVLAGYGSTAEHGSMGTMSVITSEDVVAAYRNAMEVASMVCFRSGDNLVSGMVDLADVLAGGELTVDPGAIYAQALVAGADGIALRLFQYMCGDLALESHENRTEFIEVGGRAILSFFTGTNLFSAEPYIREVMDLNGIPEEVYRFPGSGESVVTLGDLTVTVENPTVDVLGMRWVRSYVTDRDGDENEFMSFVVGVVNSAALEVAENRGLSPVTVKVDPYDGETFLDTLADAVSDAFERCANVAEYAVADGLESQTFNDPFYGDIAAKASEHSGDMVLMDEFRQRVRDALSAQGVTGREAENMLSSEDMAEAEGEYRHAVLEDVSAYNRLAMVPGGQPGLIGEILSSFVSIGLGGMGVFLDVESIAETVCREMLAHDGMNPYGGLTGIPGADCFLLTDGAGNITAESLDVTISSSPAASQPFLIDDRCIHNVDLWSGSAAAYTTVFQVKVSDSVKYDVRGRGSMASAMGTESALFSGGFTNLIELEVAVVSGWALKGVQYTASSTILTDIGTYLLELLEPIIEPLRKIMEMVKDIAIFLGEGILEALQAVATEIQAIYDRLIAPLTDLRELLGDLVDEAFGGVVLGFLYQIGLDDQKFTFQVGGYDLTVETRAITLVENTKTLFSMTLAGPVGDLMASAGITVKLRGDVATENLIVTGHGSLEGTDWDVEAHLDPLMKGSRHMLTLSGDIGDTEVTAIIPEMVEYHELGIGLGDIPGVGAVVDSIPLPVPGLTMGLDAGFNLKYSTPLVRGLLINEFESNPSGTDNGREWVEILNNTSAAIDLDGYTLIASSDWREKVMPLSGTIHPGEYMVIEPDFIMVNESGKYTKKGEALTLKDPHGAVVDKTPTMKDAEDDGLTIQRVFDGSTRWELADGSMGRSNDGYPLESVLSAGDIKDIVWSAVEDAFGDVGYITDGVSMSEFLESLVLNTLDGLIEHVTGQIVEAAVYIEVEVEDVTGSAGGRMAISLRTDGELAEDILKYVAGKAWELALNARNPYDIDLGDSFADEIDLQVVFSAGVGFPELLSDGNDVPGLDVGVMFRANLASIGGLLGWGAGTPEVSFGVGVLGCPLAAVPSALTADESCERDLWLVRFAVRFA